MSARQGPPTRADRHALKRLDRGGRRVEEFTLRPLRVRKPALKVLFVVAVFVVDFLITAPFYNWNVPGAIFVGTSIGFASWIPIVRCLRGLDEPFLPARPWWRATYRPTASILLAALFGLSLVASVVQTAVGMAPNPFTNTGPAVYFVFASLLTLVQTAYFTVSAVMLLRLSGAQPSV